MTGHLEIDTTDSTAANFFNGVIEDPRIHNHALSAMEVADACSSRNAWADPEKMSFQEWSDSVDALIREVQARQAAETNS